MIVYDVNNESRIRNINEIELKSERKKNKKEQENRESEWKKGLSPILVFFFARVGFLLFCMCLLGVVMFIEDNRSGSHLYSLDFFFFE